MLSSSFAIILYILTSLQNVHNADTSITNANSKINEALKSKNQKFNTFLNKGDFHNDDLLMDESINLRPVKDNSDSLTLKELKSALSKLLKKNKVSKRDVAAKLGKRHKENENQEKKNVDTKWDKWTQWSSCSVSCGKGRHIRWRHCQENCVDDIETEMQEKTCQLPACPHKLFGLIKI